MEKSNKQRVSKCNAKAFELMRLAEKTIIAMMQEQKISLISFANKTEQHDYLNNPYVVITNPNDNKDYYEKITAVSIFNGCLYILTEKLTQLFETNLILSSQELFRTNKDFETENFVPIYSTTNPLCTLLNLVNAVAERLETDNK